MKGIIFVILMFLIFMGQINCADTDVVAQLKIKLVRNELWAYLTIENHSKNPVVITDDHLGLCDINNLLNTFSVLEKGGEQLPYFGIVDHRNSKKHRIEPGESITSVILLNGIYDFRNVKNTVLIRYKHEILDDKFRLIRIYSNEVIYKGGALPFFKRRQMIKPTEQCVMIP